AKARRGGTFRRRGMARERIARRGTEREMRMGTMARVLALVASLVFAVALGGCLSYPDVATIEARDASVAPERPADPIALAPAEDASADAGAADAAEAHPPPPEEPCAECPPGTKCCPKDGGKKGKKGGKGKGKDEDVVEIVCKPPQADCGD